MSWILIWYAVFYQYLDQPVAQTTIKEGDEPQESNTIDPSPTTNKTPGSQVYDSPPTAADQEVPPQSITDEISRETGSTMNVNDYLWEDQTEHRKRNRTLKRDSFNIYLTN